MADQAGILEGDLTRPRRWLHDHARVRPGAEVLDGLLTLARLVDAPSGLVVAQLPGVPGQAWIGEILPANGPVPRASMVVHAPMGVDFRQPIAGLAVDSWTDVIPRRQAVTGLAFHYDAPKAQARALLVALQPDLGRPWEFEDLEATLLDTFDLARLRAKDPSNFNFFADYLPAVYHGENLQADLTR